MTDEKIMEYISWKESTSQDINFIRFTFYELRVTNGLSDERMNRLKELAKIYFENKGYQVYFEDEKYVYQNAHRTVQINEVLIAVRDEEI